MFYGCVGESESEKERDGREIVLSCVGHVNLIGAK